MLLGYTSLPSSVGPTLPDIGINTTDGHVNLRPLYGHTIGAAPAAHGTAGVMTAGPVLADLQRVPQISARDIAALHSDFQRVRLETRARTREYGPDQNTGNAGWRSPIVCDGYGGHYSGECLTHTEQC